MPLALMLPALSALVWIIREQLPGRKQSLIMALNAVDHSLHPPFSSIVSLHPLDQSPLRQMCAHTHARIKPFFPWGHLLSHAPVIMLVWLSVSSEKRMNGYHWGQINKEMHRDLALHDLAKRPARARVAVCDAALRKFPCDMCVKCVLAALVGMRWDT